MDACIEVNKVIELIKLYDDLEDVLTTKNGCDHYAHQRSWHNPDDPLDGYSARARELRMKIDALKLEILKINAPKVVKNT
jgi:hypothetical protein